MKLAIGADHRGFAHKEYLKVHMSNVTWVDVGAYTDQRSDYPLFAQGVVEALQKGEADAGILICGSGGGMAVAANRYSGIYAVVAWNKAVAQTAKEDDHANILVLPSDYITTQDALEYVRIWLQAHAKEGRYAERIAMIDKT